MAEGKKLIEMICSHNHGRSPPAETIGNMYLAELGMDSKYLVISSGSRADEINDYLHKLALIPEKEARWCVEKGLERGIYPTEQEFVEGLLKSKKLCNLEKRLFQDYAYMAAQLFVKEEHEFRERAYAELGLGKPKEKHDQTIVRPDVVLILAMGRPNLDFVNGLYDNPKTNPNGFNPVRDTLKGYVTGKQGEVFDAPYGGTYEDYMKMVQHDLCVLVPRAISRFRNSEAAKN